MSVEDRLNELGLTLPEAPGPAANYKPCVRFENLLFISGQLPMVDGKLAYAGRVGKDLDVDEGYEAAKICALNAIAQIRRELGGFDDVATVLRVDGHINCEPDFADLPPVLNGASDLLMKVFEDRAGHARVALGHHQLPLNAAVEIAMTVGLGSFR
jgi:enamine deaminase RidA (YjgF/YER057c/UK114 family)